ncbi:hypothetical protein HBH43_187720 [Parastagonospora nodorum]|nr:hypothetical protein HBH43_187720 [Parastagonospora nodorum]
MVYSIAATTIRELGVRHSLSNLSVHDLVEERRNYSLPCKLSDLYKAGTSLVIDTLTVTPIEDNDNLLNTINSHIKLRKLKEVMLLCRTIKLLSIPSADKYSKKHLKVREADASKQVGANVREEGNKNYSSLYYSDSNSDTATRKTRIKARARLIKRQRLESEAQLRKASEEEELAKTKKEKREKEAWERKAESDSLLDSDDYCSDSSPDINPEDDLEDEEATTAKDLAREQKERLKALLNAKIRDSLSARLTGAYILYFKELSSNNGRIFASIIGITRTRAIVLSAIIGHKNEVVAMNPTNSTLCDLSDPLVVRFCIFSDPALENIGILTNEEVVEMQTNTATALADKLAAVNKLVRLQTFTLKILEHVETATKHCSAPLAARFVIVCGFEKVDKHVFRAYNTMSVTAQRTIIRKGSSYIEKRGQTVFNKFHNCKSEGTIIALSGTPIEQGLNKILIFRNMIANVKHDASKHESSHKDILEKEGLDELEASRRVIFNCFKMQAIASYPALATLKAAQFKTYGSCKVKRFTSNSVKDLFTNLSKDYFLVREARAITKSSLKFQNLSNLCSESIAAEDAAKAANTLPPPKKVRAKILIGSYKPIVQAVTWLGLREKFGDESVLRDLDGPWIMVALMAFAEAITLTEATHVLAEMCVGIVYFNPDSELELKVLGKQDVKTTS